MSPEQKGSPREAGAELDALIAKEVMGWTVYEEYVHGPMMHGGAMTALYRGPGLPHNGFVPSVKGWSPSTKIEHAWYVVEKMAESFTVELDRDLGRSWWRAAFSVSDVPGDDYHFETAATAPHAICLAALKATSAPLGKFRRSKAAGGSPQGDGTP